MTLEIKEIQQLFENVFEFQKILATPDSGENQLVRLSKELKNFVHYDLLSVFSYEEKSRKCQLVCQMGDPQSLVDAVNFTLGKGGVAMSARRKVPLHLKSRFNSNVFTVHSFLTFPLIFHGETIGILALGKYKDDGFSKKQVLYLKIFSIYFQNVLIFLRFAADNKKG